MRRRSPDCPRGYAVHRMRFLRKKQTVPVRRTSGRASGARRTASQLSPLAFFAGRVGGIVTGPATLLNGIRGSVHAKGLVLWAVALAIGILCVWQHVYASRLALQIDGLRAERGNLEAQIGFLEMDCVALSSRERVERYAMDHLGMRYPEQDEVVRLGEVPPREEGGAGYVARDERAPTNG